MASIDLFDFTLDSKQIKKQISDLTNFIEKEVKKLPDLRIKADIDQAEKALKTLSTAIKKLPKSEQITLSAVIAKAQLNITKINKI